MLLNPYLLEFLRCAHIAQILYTDIPAPSQVLIISFLEGCAHLPTRFPVPCLFSLMSILYTMTRVNE